MHPQAITGFIDLITHPWLGSTPCRKRRSAPIYQIVEVGFGTTLQGAKVQPWHRDIPATKEAHEDHRMMSLAFNVAGVDVTPDMGPIAIAPGTQWDDRRTWQAEMLPERSLWPRYK